MKGLFLILFLIFFKFSAYTQEIKIIFKVNNEIITNIDIDNEYKYLITFNQNLNNLNKNEIIEIAKKYIIQEKIKNKEIKNLIKIKDKNFESKVISNFFRQQGFDTEADFKNFLDTNNLNYDFLKSKILGENLWRQIIYEKFKNKLKIDKNKIQMEIKETLNKNNKLFEYNISEILIKKDQNYIKEFKKIKEQIKESNFQIAASKFSVSDTSKMGGLIGWIEGSTLSPEINNLLKKLNVNELTEPFEVPGGYLILRLNDKKEIIQKQDLEKQTNLRINFEINKQLTQYSLMYYKKLEQNALINES